MRLGISQTISAGLLCSWLLLTAGCSNPSSQSLNSLTVQATPSSVTAGSAVTLKATAHLSDGTTQDVTTSTQWTLSNNALGTLGSGTLTTKAAGTLTVQGLYVMAAPAIQSSSSTPVAAQNLTASAQVTINAASSTGGGSTTTTPTATITWAAPLAIQYGTTLSNAQLNAAATVPGTFVYTPAAGTVLKAGTQTLSVAFTPTDTSTASAATSSVQLTVNQATPTVTWPTLSSIQQGTALSAAQLDATASVPGTFTYSPAAGTLLSSGIQQLTTAFTPTDATDYAAVTAKNSVSVLAPGAAGSATITWATPSAIPYGTALSGTQLNATASVPGTFVYTPAAGTILKLGTQSLSVVFTPTNTSTASAATATVQLTINKGTPTVTWPAPANIQQGTALGAAQLNATANVPGIFTYSPAAGTVLSSGVQPLTAAFAPTDATDYAAVTVRNSITVGTANSTPPPTTTPIPPAPTSCGGPTINLNSGMSTSTIQSTISNASDCSLIVFGAGNYNITSQINIPCPKTGMTLTGPATGYPQAWNARPTAILTSGMTQGAPLFSMSPCASSQGVTIEYLDFNGNRPATGGGSIYVPDANYSNLTLLYNYFHGNQEVVPYTCGSANNQYWCYEDSNSTLVYLDGDTGTSGKSTGPVNTNTTIKYNIFGNPTPGDCSNVMTWIGGPINGGASWAGYDVTGGECGALGVHISTTNLTFEYNIIQQQEQPLKFYEGGSSAPNLFYQTNDNIEYNDIGFYHRIATETQQSPVDSSQPTNWSFNDVHDQQTPSFGSWSLSAPQGSYTNANDNVMISNTNTNGSAGPGDFEFWGTGDNDHNLEQGYISCGHDFGYGVTPNGSISYNIHQLIVGNCNTGSVQGIQNEYSGNIQPATFPAMVGNTFSTTPATQTSTAPTISPAGGSFSGSQVVTLTDAGNTSAAGPRGNTGVWCTTDGSTPAPKSGTSQYYASGATLTLTASTTLKCVGMWGAITQPASYPAGYGYVPSAVVSAGFVAKAVEGPTSKVRSTSISPNTQAESATMPSASSQTANLQSVTITPSAPVVAVGSSTQLKAVATFSDGSVKDVTSDFVWQSSNLRTMVVNASGLLSGLATGKAKLSGSYQGQQASVAASSIVGEVEWSAPIVIARGGTYSGNWRSTNAQTAAVIISTQDPVVIQDSHISSASNLIQVSVRGANVTVRNSLALGLNASVKGQPNGVFLDITSPARLDVENNYIENVRDGVSVHGYSGGQNEQQTLVIRGNRARNFTGLLSDGAGGYLPEEGANLSVSRFVELDSVQSVPGIDVGWNEIVDYPKQSRVSDVINIYRSSGTPNQPLEVHDTYIQGAYPYQPAKDAYLGGGIKTDGNADDTARNASAYAYIHDNQVVSTVSYGIALNAGHDNIAANNRVISSGLLTDGTIIAAQQVGLSNADTHGDASHGSHYNNTMHDNVVGWACWTSSCAGAGYRQDQYLPGSPQDYSNNESVPAGPITLDMEESEYLLWLNKTVSAGVRIGPSF
jgi:Bacterial Ig-like domain (group 2)